MAPFCLPRLAFHCSSTDFYFFPLAAILVILEFNMVFGATDGVSTASLRAVIHPRLNSTSTAIVMTTLNTTMIAASIGTFLLINPVLFYPLPSERCKYASIDSSCCRAEDGTFWQVPHFFCAAFFSLYSTSLASLNARMDETLVF